MKRYMEPSLDGRRYERLTLLSCNAKHWAEFYSPEPQKVQNLWTA
jgi:hypothetical protein